MLVVNIAVAKVDSDRCHIVNTTHLRYTMKFVNVRETLHVRNCSMNLHGLSCVVILLAVYKLYEYTSTRHIITYVCQLKTSSCKDICTLLILNLILLLPHFSTV